MDTSQKIDVSSIRPITYQYYLHEVKVLFSQQFTIPIDCLEDCPEIPFLNYDLNFMYRLEDLPVRISIIANIHSTFLVKQPTTNENA